MRYGRQRWRLRGRVEVSNKQMWDSEEYIFLPLVTELLSIKVMRSAAFPVFFLTVDKSHEKFSLPNRSLSTGFFSRNLAKGVTNAEFHF